MITVAVTGTKTAYTPVDQDQRARPLLSANGDLRLTPYADHHRHPEGLQCQLTAVPGTWDSGVTFTYQWTVDGTNVAGATGSTYTPVAADAGKVITVKVTGAKTAYNDVTKQSAATSAVAAGDLTHHTGADHHGHPEGRGGPHRGPGHLGLGHDVQLPVDRGRLRTSPAPPARRTRPSPRTPARSVTVKVTGTKTGYSPVTKQSAATAAVALGDQVLTPKPTITGTPKVGVPLTAVTGTWDSGVTFTYQWTVNSINVAGATGSTYTPARPTSASPSRSPSPGPRPATTRPPGPRTAPAAWPPATRR